MSFGCKQETRIVQQRGGFQQDEPVPPDTLGGSNLPCRPDHIAGMPRIVIGKVGWELFAESLHHVFFQGGVVHELPDADQLHFPFRRGGDGNGLITHLYLFISGHLDIVGRIYGNVLPVLF